MTGNAQIDKAGRIVLPKKFRDALHLVPGTKLKIERSGDTLMLEQDYPEVKLEMRDGLLVMIGGPPASKSAVELIEEDRVRRIRYVSGESDEP